MLEEDNPSYDAHCATFNTSLDLATSTTEAFMAQSMRETPDLSTAEEFLPMECAWSNLLINTTELLKDDERPSKSIYELSLVWERPPGQAV